MLCSMDIPAQPPQHSVKGAFVRWVTSSALTASDTNKHQKGGGVGGTPGHFGVQRHLMIKLRVRHQPFLVRTLRSCCDSHNRQSSAEWIHARQIPVWGSKDFLDNRPRHQITDWKAAQVKHSNTDSRSQEKRKITQVGFVDNHKGIQ